MTRTNIPALFRIAPQSNPYLKEQKSYIQSLLQVLSKVTVLINGHLLHATVQKVFPIFKELILISPTVQWNMLTHSVSTLLSHIYIDSMTVFWISIMHFRIQIFPFMKGSTSINHPIIQTGLIYLTSMFLSIDMRVHFFINS